MRLPLLLWLVAAEAFVAGADDSRTFATFDFKRSETVALWRAAHDVSAAAGAEGMTLRISGEDPYLHGPPMALPAGQPLWLDVRLKSDQGGAAQVFYFQTNATEVQSVRFAIPAGVWFDARAPLPPLGPGWRLRLDPPGQGGLCRVDRLALSARNAFDDPDWPSPALRAWRGEREVTSGPLRLLVGAAIGDWRLQVGGVEMATGHNRLPLGYQRRGAARWLPPPQVAQVGSVGAAIRQTSVWSDVDGGRWRWEMAFRPAARAGAVEVESSLECSEERELLFAPLFIMLPGAGTFGASKDGGLLAGVEYLDNEPSSSEADARGEQSLRRTPEAHKLTFPLMALVQGGRWVALNWGQHDEVTPLFDSPDRIFHSGGHVMGLIAPGSRSNSRPPGSLAPYQGWRLPAAQPLRLRAQIWGGSGDSLAPAVKEYVARVGLPRLPDSGYAAADYVRLTSVGWLTSKLREGALFRHAVGANFAPGPASDAALCLDWLAGRAADGALSNRLASLASEAISMTPGGRENETQIGHVRIPAPALVFGNTLANAVAARDHGLRALAALEGGVAHYSAPRGGPDLALTHWARHANGLTATALHSVLADAIFSGDPGLAREGVRLAHGLRQYGRSVPRGAQSWEVPLHAPDILASAYLSRCCTMAYELSGDPGLLEDATYWAWTGVPFVYLQPSTVGPVGVYATTPVLGATLWIAPLWIGLPVQWCGLVYADAVRRLSRYDPDGPWLSLANGIARSGLQQTHPLDDPAFAGLLPDSFDLVSQTRNPVPINPATLWGEAAQAFGYGPLYDYRVARSARVTINAPGAIVLRSESPSVVEFGVEGWPAHPHFVLVTGLTARPRVAVNGEKANFEYDGGLGAASVRVSQHSVVRVEW